MHHSISSRENRRKQSYKVLQSVMPLHLVTEACCSVHVNEQKGEQESDSKPRAMAFLQASH